MFSILFVKIYLFFCIDYYFNYFRYIDLKKRIRVSFFFEKILNVFDLVGYLENSISSTGIKKNWILWKEPNIVWTMILLKWSFDIYWNKIESGKNLIHLIMLWTLQWGWTLTQKLISSRTYQILQECFGPFYQM